MVKFNFTLSAVNGEKKTAKQVYGVVRRNAHVPYGDFAKFKDIVGVYYIKCKTTNKQYVGSTTNVAERIGKHFSELFNNKHTNKRLQKDFNDYGYNDFCFDIYLICTKDALSQEEKRIQIEIGINNLYNLKISCYYMDEELRKQYANTDKSSHKTKEFREKMSKLKSNYITQYDLNGNSIAIWNSVNEIVDKLGYTASVIRCGCNGSKKHPYGFYWRYTDSKGNPLANGYGNKQD